MESLGLDPVPACVVAWHNRHPLARRVTTAHVSSLGYVALPFVQTPGRRSLRPGFDEDFLDGASPRAVARWAARHGVPLAEPPADGPLRVVRAASHRFAPDDTQVTLIVRTAFVDDGWLQSRVLVGGGARPSVFGPRLWSRPRRAAAGGVLASLAVGAAVLLRPAGEATPVLAAAAPAPAASAALAVASASAPEAKPTPEPPVAAARPPDVDPQWGTIDLPRLKPHLGGREPDLARAPAPPPPVSASASAVAAPPAPAPAAPPKVAARAPAPPPAPAAPAPDLVWALATPPLRSEAEGERLSVTVAALFQRAGLRSVRVETLEIDGRWHVVGLPFPSRDAAENAQHLLATRGVRTQPVEF